VHAQRRKILSRAISAWLKLLAKNARSLARNLSALLPLENKKRGEEREAVSFHRCFSQQNTNGKNVRSNEERNSFANTRSVLCERFSKSTRLPCGRNSIDAKTTARDSSRVLFSICSCCEFARTRDCNLLLSTCVNSLILSFLSSYVPVVRH